MGSGRSCEEDAARTSEPRGASCLTKTHRVDGLAVSVQIHLLTETLYSLHSAPKASANIASSARTKRRSIRTGNANTGIRELAVPSNMATPRSIRVTPTYMGLRLIEKGNEVTSAEDRSNGFMVVAFCRNCRSAVTFRRMPTATGSTPRSAAGNVQYRYRGAAK